MDAAITGGLCMANMGGSGDMLILAAGHRMGLMTYASISSRIGGAKMCIRDRDRTGTKDGAHAFLL